MFRYLLILMILASSLRAAIITNVSIYSVSSEYTSGWDLRAIHVVDGSGLSSSPAGHAVTDPSGNSWQTSSQTGTADIQFDLGNICQLTNVHVWNLNFYAPYNGRGANQVTIRTSNNASTWNTEGTYAFTQASGVAGDLGFDIDPAGWQAARYVDFQILNNFGGGDNAGHIGLSEVQFRAVTELSTPTQNNVTNNLRIWLKADTITNTVPGSPVVSWPDSSGNGFHFYQTVPAMMPLWQPNRRGGLPAVHFDGSDDALWRENLAGSDFMTPTQATVFCVFTRESNNPRTSLFGWGPAAMNNRFFLHATWQGIISFQHGSAPGTAWSQLPDWDDNWHVINVWRDGNIGSGMVDGFVLGDQNAMPDSPDMNYSSTFDIGRDPYGNFLKGEIGELLVYNRKLTDAERASVLQYLYSRWMRPAITSLTQSATEATLATQNLTANRTNIIESATDLSGNVWLPVTNYLASTVSTNTTVPWPTAGNVFYRIKTEF